MPARRLGFSTALFLLACAGRSTVVDRSASLLTSAPPPDGRICFVSTKPETLPTSATLVDTGALIHRLQLSSHPARAYALVSVRFDDQGQATLVRMIEGTLHEDEVQRQVSSFLKPQAPRPMWSVRIRISLDTAPAFQIGRSEICPATPSGRGTIDVVTSRTVTSSNSPSSLPSLGDSRAPRFSILVDTAGHVLQVRLDESSGNDDVDRQFRDHFQTRAFQPTLLDRVPILAWTQWPLQPR